MWLGINSCWICSKFSKLCFMSDLKTCEQYLVVATNIQENAKKCNKKMNWRNNQCKVMDPVKICKRYCYCFLTHNFCVRGCCRCCIWSSNESWIEYICILKWYNAASSSTNRSWTCDYFPTEPLTTCFPFDHNHTRLCVRGRVRVCMCLYARMPKAGQLHSQRQLINIVLFRSVGYISAAAVVVVVVVAHHHPF